MNDKTDKTEPDLSVLRMEREGAANKPVEAGRSRRLLVGLVVLAAAAIFAVVAVPRLPWIAPEIEAATVRVLTPGEASQVLTATGYTYARERASVGAKIIGRVERLLVDEGDRVRRGDTIAVLDSDDLVAELQQRRAALLEARANLADAQRQESRFARLLAEKAIAQAEYDAEATRLEVMEAHVAVAEANLANARARLQYAVIRAPIPGVVIERRIEVGEMVAPGGFTTQQATGAIVRIANPESLEVEADINESYISRLSLGQPSVIRVDAVPGREYRGRLRQIVPTADRQRAVVQVKVTIDDRDDRLLPDMSCNVTFLEEESQAESTAVGGPMVVAPQASVLQDADGSHVYVLVDDRVRRIAVELGEEVGDDVEIRSGLSGGERVAVTGFAGLEDGRRVRIR
ncbi:MAG: efflux RND transporter periplasmic adaptor subunit [Gemmatimonadales bacterium]